MSTPLSIRGWTLTERHSAGLLDTSVIIDLDRLAPEDLPHLGAVSAVTMAELAAGPSAATDSAERARRQDRLQRTEAVFDAVPFDGNTARAFGRIYAAVRETERQPRRRMADLLIAATALAEGMPLYTRNVADFKGLEQLVQVVGVDIP